MPLFRQPPRPASRTKVAAAAAALWALSLVLLSAAGPAAAEGLVVATPAWPGLANPDGTGLYFDLLREVYRPRGFRVVHRIVPWKRAKKMLLHHRADLVPAAYLTPGRKQWLYPRYPLDVDQVLAVRRANGAPWRGQESLRDRKVVWPTGYNFQNYLDVPVAWSEIASPEQGWAMVAKGRADYYLDIAAEIQPFLQGARPRPVGLAAAPVAQVRTYLRLAAGPRSRRLAAIYDRAFPRLKGSGRLRELFDKWGVPYPFGGEVAPRPEP
jgi:polar amino acid transport system substrate-binding protein